MATILRSYKYFNIFTGHYLKTYKNGHFPLQHVLKTHNGATHANREYSTVTFTEFVDKKSTSTPLNILQDIEGKYLSYKNVSYLEVLNFLNSFESSFLVTSEKLLIENNIHLLIDCCGKGMKNEMPNVRAQLTNNLWSLLKSLDLQLNLFHYNALLRVYLENEQDFSPAKILLEMNNKGIEPDNLTYEYLLIHYCRKGNIEEANKILNYLKESEIPVNENVFNALIIGNAEANDMKGALNIFSFMKVMGCPPSSKTYAALLEAYAKKGKIGNIMETMKNCESKDIVLLDKYKMDIIYYLAINGHGKHIDEILPTLAWDNSFINESLNFIAKLMCHKQIDVAIQVIQCAKEAGLQESHLNAMSRNFAKNIIGLDLPEEKIIENLDLFEKQGFFMYEKALDESFRSQNLKYSIPLLRAWSRNGFEVKEHFFWPILALHGTRNTKGIFETLQTMKNEIGITPSFETLTRFILPYITTGNSNEIANLLISDFGIPTQSAINAVLFYDLSINKLDSAVKNVKASANYNIIFDKKKLLPVLQKAVSMTGDEFNYKFLKNKFEEKSDIRKRSNIPNTNFLPPILENIHKGFKLQTCCKKGDLVGADKCIRELKQFQRCYLPIEKLLCYFDLLVKNDRITDALQIFKHFSSNSRNIIWFDQENIKHCRSTMNLLAEKGSVEGVNQLFDFLVKKQKKFAIKFSNYLVQVHLVRKESKEALEVVKKIYKNYNHIPGSSELMKTFIETEEVESLQWLTDFCMQHKGERSTLMLLAVSFLQCQRLRQSKKILESLRVPLKDDSLRIHVNKLFADEEISVVKDLLQVTKGLNAINRNVLYEMLLEKYSVMNNWEEGLALWEMMQKEGTIPSGIFLEILSELMKRNGQATPMEVKSTYDMKVQDDFYAKVTKMYIKNNSYPCKDFMDVLVEKLVDADDIETIELIENKWLDLHNEHLTNRPFKFEVCVKANKVDSYLEQLKTKLESSDRTEFFKYIECVNKSWLNYLLKHPEKVESFEALAMQILSKNAYLKPFLVVLTYYFLKDVPKAKELWTQMPDIQATFCYKLIIEGFVTEGFFDKLPLLAEVFHESLNFYKKNFYEEFLKTYEKHNKYEEGLDVLARFKPLKQNKMNIKEEHQEINPELMKSQLTL